MSRRGFQIAAWIIIVFAALTPLVESFDHWDKSPGPANDSEIHVTAWFVGAGIVLTLATLPRYTLDVLFCRYPSPLYRVCSPLRIDARGLPEPTASPPVVALRI